ncbi:MAG TPA: TrkA family potassium uptake protein [candidate division WOR-3 bacterium]|uniref:TrkA family potassium uptake protein n=1 Tax=candidate division WOR-3 bacterium TaxID=2052148 RepID=A0A7V0T4C7_UNCW3|nr:TrkA family potassium uptake protein [candidate division WOR-3 bacterium]
MKQFAVIGLGTFGSRVALTLMEKGAEVIGIDVDPARVEQFKDDLTQTLALDATDEEVLARSGVLDLDAVVVAMGERMEAAILVTAILRRLGAGHVIARAASGLYAQILEDVGADRTVLIEEQMAAQVARNLIAPDVLDQITLATGHSLVEMKPRREMVGRKLGELNLRRRYNVNVVVIKKRVPVITETGESDHELRVNDIPGPEDRLEDNDILVVVGRDEDIEKLSTGK